MIGQTNHSAAKAGIVGMTKAASKELAHPGARQRHPAWTDPLGDDRGDAATDWDSKVAEVPLGRAGEPYEVANVALFPARPLVVHDRHGAGGHRAAL